MADTRFSFSQDKLKTIADDILKFAKKRDALQAKLDKEGAQARALHSKVNAYESEIEGIRTQSSVKSAALQGSLDLFKQEQSTLQAELQSRAQEVAQLRAVTVQAKERIDAVLMRLPGAQPEEQS